MTFTKLAVAAGVVLFGFVCWLAAIGFQAATEGIVTLGALVLLVAGGNYLRGQGSGGRASSREPVPWPPRAAAGAADAAVTARLAAESEIAAATGADERERPAGHPAEPAAPGADGGTEMPGS